MKTPSVSVVMPTYNCEDFVKEAIDSVLAQDLEDVELIVIDDGSTDSTRSIIESFGTSVRAVSQKNAGAAAARNHGIRLARGKYISFLDADDLWHPQKLSSQFAYLERHVDVGLVFSDWMEWMPATPGEWTVPEEFLAPYAESIVDESLSGWLYADLLMDCVLHTITVLVRKSVVDEIGAMREDLVTGEDYDYWLRVSRSYEIHKLMDVVALYRIRPGSLVRQVHERNYEFDVVNNAVQTWGTVSPDGTSLPKRKLRQRISRLWLDFAYDHFHDGDPALAAMASRHIIRQRPLWITGWKYLFLATAKRIVQRK